MLCCANIAGALLTADGNPAVPGEQFYIFTIAWVW